MNRRAKSTRAASVWTAMTCLALAALFQDDLAHADAAPQRARVPGGTFATVLPPANDIKTATVRPFELDRTPVTNAAFARFVTAHPEWQRDRVARVFADQSYLLHWAGPSRPAAGTGNQPVTQVSWFAANAYCEAQGARLPTWYEWELVGAASKDLADARADPAWRQSILDWYAKPAGNTLPEVGRTEPNFYGVRDIHGMVWEWVLDLGSMMVSADNREQGDPNVSKFCGSGALSFEEKENYAMLMRIATLSSMQASYTSSTMGFRCAADAAAKP
jgi:formylglycine-generating enzyme required for sulfatase activity